VTTGSFDSSVEGELGISGESACTGFFSVSTAMLQFNHAMNEKGEKERENKF
jgi:hypothetical protein